MAGAGTTAVVVGAGGVATAVVVGAGGATTVEAGPGFEPPARGGEECLTFDQKLCPLCVFTMAGLEKERIWRGWEEERFQK